MKIFVAGPTTFNDYEFVEKKLDEFIEKNQFTDVTIISSTLANGYGVAKSAYGYAEERKYPIRKYGMRREAYRKKAQKIQEKLMIAESDAAVIFLPRKRGKNKKGAFYRKERYEFIEKTIKEEGLKFFEFIDTTP